MAMTAEPSHDEAAPGRRALTPKMRTTLEALSEHEGIIYAGVTAGEVEASGGSRGVLYSAVRKGWVNRYAKERDLSSDRDNTPRYYRTTAGTTALRQPAVPELKKVRIKPFTLDVDPAVWQKHFGDRSAAAIQAGVQAAVEAWATNYIEELGRTAGE